MRNMTLAKLAYEAYRDSAGGKSLISGEPLPDFDDLRFEIQQAWADAADAVKASL